MRDGDKRAVIYLRISKLPKGSQSKLRDEGGASYSVENQDERCTRMCEQAGYEVVSRYYDDGVSAYRSLRDRPGYGDMKTALAAGAFDVLVFDRQDRLARDQTETLRFVADCKEAGIAWHSVREHHIDLTEPMHVLFAIFRGGEAERYSATISLNQRANNIAKRAAGLPGAGPRPFGWEKWDPQAPADQPIREDEADLIRRGTEMILGGAPRYQVTKMFNQSGVLTSTGKTWHSAKVGKVLSRWRNAGLTEFDGEPVAKAIWPAIVSEEDVRNVRAILSRGRAPGRWKTPTMLCSGIARCRCGYQLVATGSVIGPAYRCGELLARPNEADRSPGPHVTIGAKLLDPIVREAVVDTYFQRPATAGAGKVEAAQIATLYEQQEKLRAERRRVQDDRRAGIYTQAEAVAEIVKVEAEINRLTHEADSLQATSAHAALLAASMNEWTADLDLDDSAHGEGTFSPSIALAQSEVRRGRSVDDARNAAARAQWQHLEHDDRHGPRAGMKVDSGVWDTVATKFDAMSLEQQRHLVRSLLSVTVEPGQGRGRIVIEPLPV